MSYNLKQSNDKQQFSTGAQRDGEQGKPRLELISPIFLDHLGTLLAKGANHYGARNWEKGIPLSRLLSSAMRHLNQTLDGQDDEDHPIQCAFNLMAYVHTLHRIRSGSLPAELDDLPREQNLGKKPPFGGTSSTNIIKKCVRCPYKKDVSWSEILESTITCLPAGDCPECRCSLNFREKNLKADLTSTKKLPTIKRTIECCNVIYFPDYTPEFCDICKRKLNYEDC